MTAIPRGRAARLAIVMATALVALAVGAATAGAQTTADRDVPAGLDRSIRSPHFVAHFTKRGPSRARSRDVRTYLRAAELALTQLTTVFGFDPPRRDRDGRVDIYVHAQLGRGFVAQAGADDNRAGVPSSGFLEVGTDQAGDQGTLAHELLHVIQFGYGMGTERDWFLEGTAAWASAVLFNERTTDSQFFTPIGARMLCDPARRCPGDGGYGYWRFWQSLTERFGNDLVADVFQRERALILDRGGDRSLVALSGALQARGSSLPAAFQEYVERSARSDWIHPVLKAIPSIVTREAAPGEELAEPLRDGAAQLPVTLSPLSGRYVRVTEPEGTPCAPSTLTLTVAVPSGVTSIPSVLVSTGGAAQLLPFSPGPGGLVASTAWQRCQSNAYVLLSTAAPGIVATFTVSASVAPA